MTSTLLLLPICQGVHIDDMSRLHVRPATRIDLSELQKVVVPTFIAVSFSSPFFFSILSFSLSFRFSFLHSFIHTLLHPLLLLLIESIFTLLLLHQPLH